jgi:hypothetical protein
MAGEQKLDLYKLHKAEYAAAKAPKIVMVGPATYLAIEGQGAPEGEQFQSRLPALYGAAFTIKMTRKFAGMGDYKVCALEGLWWCDGYPSGFAQIPREQWRWKLLIRTPEFVAQGDLEQAREALRKKGKGAHVEELRLETIDEGQCVQILHVGPYSDEPASIRAMHELAAANGLSPHGRHHEIYLSDPRRVAPARLRTILRQPVRAS